MTKLRKCDKKIPITTRQPKNLQRIVTGNNKGEECGAPPPNPGCFKCPRKCKVSCPVLQEGQQFQSTNPKKVYTIKKHLNGESDFVIYLGTCQKCKGQYVGKTQTLIKTRHSNHNQQIKRQVGGLRHHNGGPQRCGYQTFFFSFLIRFSMRTRKVL